MVAAGSDSRARERVDSRTGTREIVEFFEGGQGGLFGCTYLPPARPTAGVVVCCSLLAEFLRNYRKEVVLARTLSAEGFAVQRFHYFGSGNSDGEQDELSFESMRRDSIKAAEHLVRRSGVKQLLFLGVRLGAIVAAAAARTWNDVPVVLWEPAVDGRRYFHEVFRARRIRDLKEGEATPGEICTPEDELADTGLTDILGYTITAPLYNSTVGRSLVTEFGDHPRRVCLVQMGRTSSLRGDYQRLVDELTRRGFDVDTVLFNEDVPWWFTPNVWRADDTPATARALARLTTDRIQSVVLGDVQ